MTTPTATPDIRQQFGDRCADPDTRRRRRKTLIIALLQFPIAILLIQLSLNVRWSVGTRAEIVATESARPPTRATLGNLTMAASGLGLLGGVTRHSTGATGPSIARIPSATGRSAAADRAIAPGATARAGASDRMAAFEARVAALEKWRDGTRP